MEPGSFEKKCTIEVGGREFTFASVNEIRGIVKKDHAFHKSLSQEVQGKSPDGASVVSQFAQSLSMLLDKAQGNLAANNNPDTWQREFRDAYKTFPYPLNTPQERLIRFLSNRDKALALGAWMYFYKGPGKIDEKQMPSISQHGYAFAEVWGEHGYLSNFQSEYESLKREINDDRALLNSTLDKFRRGYESNVDFYEKQLQLKRPVQLWDELGESYEKKARKWAVATYACTFLLFLLLSFFVYSRWEPNLGQAANQDDGSVESSAPASESTEDVAEKRSSTYGFPLSSSTVQLLIWTTLGGYVIRTCSKNWSSASHLSVVAFEKKAMAETYLGLEKENALKDDQKSVVLAALFRESNTGLIRDEGNSLSLQDYILNSTRR